MAGLNISIDVHGTFSSFISYRIIAFISGTMEWDLDIKNGFNIGVSFFFLMVDYISQEKWLLLHDFPTIAFILFLINYSYSSSRRHNIKKSKNNKKNQNTIKKIISKIFWYFTRLLWLRIEHRRYDILYIHIQTVVKNGRLYSNIKSMIKILWQGHHVTW